MQYDMVILLSGVKCNTRKAGTSLSLVRVNTRPHSQDYGIFEL